ncbi:SDR family oxidoreductase [Pseudomonas panipatensis]|uniref:Short-chain dehydrogenase n=1 Tax=Pseudomonas panipatensis TaxID=428992 RepID=A0A1G8F773_9PSED|nr:SDR family oxidoreductase [Pseudomonas panipatensis]SDH77947.1 Short-chain dehydrogenase [Pseudomonas panipatensis]SMP55126.1 Short-chain dehydrogenase [Pseudomonas panipatensis]
MDSILISGAASGIGAASARLFHARGWRVGLLDMNGDALERLSEGLGGAWRRVLDVTDGAAVRAALADFVGAGDGRLRLLFNCAGVLRFGRFEEIAVEEHGRLLAINVQGLLNCCHAAFPYLKATPGAQVLNMGSASGLYGVPEMASYSASKFAVRGLTEALELEWRRHGIRVADLMPPFVRTPMVTSQTVEPPVLRRLGVTLTAEDIAAAAWRQARSGKVHRPIGALFRAMYWSGQLSPPALNRWVMAWLSRD